MGYQAEPACLLDGVVDDVGSLLRQHVAGSGYVEVDRLGYRECQLTRMLGWGQWVPSPADDDGSCANRSQGWVAVVGAQARQVSDCGGYGRGGQRRKRGGRNGGCGFAVSDRGQCGAQGRDKFAQDVLGSVGGDLG
jgi:hypothetical protein